MQHHSLPKTNSSVANLSLSAARKKGTLRLAPSPSTTTLHHPVDSGNRNNELHRKTDTMSHSGMDCNVDWNLVDSTIAATTNTRMQAQRVSSGINLVTSNMDQAGERFSGTPKHVQLIVSKYPHTRTTRKRTAESAG